MSSDIANVLSSVFSLALPEIVLGLAACVLFLGGTFRQDRSLWGSAALMALLAAGLVLFLQARDHSTINAEQQRIEQLKAAGHPTEVWSRNANLALYVSPLLWSELVIVFQIVALAGGTVLVLASWNDAKDDTAGEYFACLLTIIAGLMLVPSANDLVTLFLSLELISIPTYVILYTQRHDLAGQEAAAKYFLLSILSSALLLFGFSYLYGTTGTTNIPAILNGLLQTDARTGTSWLPDEPQRLPALALVALVMIVAGLGFRITAFPFHFYSPDVFQGTSITMAALLAFVPKVAGFAALMRVLGFVEAPLGAVGSALGPRVPILFLTIAALTMIIGNVLGLLQDNLRRLLAYSSVANAGYMMVGLAAAPGLTGARPNPIDTGLEAVVFYLVAYGAMTIGAFAVLAYLQGGDQPVETVDDLAGLSQNHPLLALMMAVFLFSLIGVPATAGFVGKLLLFLAALAVPEQQGLPQEYLRLFPYLALTLALTAAVGAWYYLRIIAAMYLRTPLRPRAVPRRWPIVAAIGVCAAVTIIGGVYPEPLVRVARAAVLP